MRKALNPYYFVVLLVAASSLVFSKINKRSFYQHYFKVIADVEVRNSQALLVYVTSWAERNLKYLGTHLQLFVNQILVIFAFTFLAPSLSFLSSFRPHIWPKLSAKVYRRFQPALAP